MAEKNGYFQLLYSSDASYVRLFPPVDGGERIRTDELRDYLVARGFHIDIVEFNREIENLKSEPVNIQLSSRKGIACPESFTITVSPDKMTAVARFFPCSTQGAALTRESIISDLNFKGIKKGIDEKVIGDFLSNKRYCTDYVIAVGEKPTPSTDASIKYFFNTNPNTKPTQNEDGTVDFFNLNTISKCTKGQVLAELTKENRGIAGYNVFGEPIPSRDPKRLGLKYGRNIELSEDGLKISAMVDGHVSLVGDKVFVSDVYEVVDVDTATGNIEYKGDVLVTGNVKAGFCVFAEGNVEVRGVVEGAMIEATGDVIIFRGMNGMGKGVINAGGNVVAKFFENTTVSAGGYVRAEAVLHSKIQAKGDVDINGKKGFITGGTIKSLGTVSAKTIGTEMGVDTEIEVGVDPKLKNRCNALAQSIANDRKRLAMVEPVVVTFTKKMKAGDKLTAEQAKYFKQLVDEYKKLTAAISHDETEYEQLMAESDNNDTDAVIKVSQTAFVGTKLTIGDVSTTLSTSVSHARFVREGADIRIRAL